MSLRGSSRTNSAAELLEYLRAYRTADAVGQLVPQMAHDMNNLLAIASTNIAIASAIAPDSQAKQYCDAASESLTRVGALAQRMAATSSAYDDRVEVNALIVELEQLFAERLGQDRCLKLLLNAPRDVVETDLRTFSAALLNLVLNAGEALPDDGICTIATHTRTIELPNGLCDCMVISVIDTGTGMTEDVSARAFELFFSTKAPDRGIGLSQVKDFVRRSGGHIGLRSRPEKGTAVHIALPLKT